jgi:hypothetical protein
MVYGNLDQYQRNQQYQYTANSNLVLHTDRSSLPRRDQEPTGEPETLWGKIKPKAFGDKAVRTIDEEKAKRDKKRKEQEEKLRASGAERQVKKSKRDRYSCLYRTPYIHRFLTCPLQSCWIWHFDYSVCDRRLGH